jgi:hypothetical protein
VGREFGATPGVAPLALQLSADGKLLFVACAGLNAVAVMETASGATKGYIPVGWYPSSLALSPDGKRLAVGSLLGAGTTGASKTRRSMRAVRGMVNVVELPDAVRLREYTAAVRANNRASGSLPHSGGAGCGGGETIPRCAGDVSPIEHVVFIIKENRTYDQLLGDLERGNGDATLTMYPRRVTPNHHRLAEQFTTLDNFYATGGVSPEGHAWLTQAYASAYLIWPGYAGRSYPYDGTDPLAYSPKGFLWDLARAGGKSVRVYGEMAPSVGGAIQQYGTLLREWAEGADFSARFQTKAQLPTLNEVLAPNYPSFGLSIPDVVRARIFLKDLSAWSAAGSMPHLVMLQLPCDHTMGTTPGAPSPSAMMADNDLALGQMVDALSKSPFWPKMAIFVVEDDAQDGVDHVDGHRTVALAVSPYTRRGTVDSTFYSQQSLLKTIERILGLPALSLFDLIAGDMRASFTAVADLTPYEHEEPAISLTDTNPELKTLQGQTRRDAIASRRMNWREPDDVPSDVLNRILWRHAKGLATAYPGVREAAFLPVRVEAGEKDRRE